jgi:hypothetical protein
VAVREKPLKFHVFGVPLLFLYHYAVSGDSADSDREGWTTVLSCVSPCSQLLAGSRPVAIYFSRIAP